jgi:hypothetical protein
MAPTVCMKPYSRSAKRVPLMDPESFFLVASRSFHSTGMPSRLEALFQMVPSPIRCMAQIDLTLDTPKCKSSATLGTPASLAPMAIT